MRWSWSHTIGLFFASLVLTWIIYVLTGWFFFLLILVPPAIHIFSRRK
jgi:hypothetical protein